MSGHSKWAQIKHKKAATDAKKGQVFSKMSRMITIAAKEKGGDPSMNPKLRMFVEKARSLGLPKENIERAIKKATDTTSGESLEETRYEAYGPGGIAILIDCVTDNKNRTTAEIKHILSEYGGKFAQQGSVEWLFEKVGALDISLTSAASREELELTLIDCGAENIENNAAFLTAYANPANLAALKGAVEKKQLPITEEYITYVPKNPVEITNEETKNKIIQLLEILDDHEDIQEVYTNLK